MDQYKRHTNAKSVLAVCFTMAEETFHHWRVFANGANGVRVEFKNDAFDAVLKIKNVRAKAVKYKMIREIKKLRPSVDDLPFLKRQPYSDEKEFRIVFVDKSKTMETKEFDINLNCIRRVTLSPWLLESRVDAVKSKIHSIPRCDHIKVYQTTLLENENWKRAATLAGNRL
jgi:hypothetical protein